MQLIKIVLHGILKDKFASFEIAASTAAEAIEGWSRQVGMDQIPMQQRPVMQALGFDTDVKLHAKTDVTELHLAPAMFGGGGVGKIILGAALIVGGVLLIPVSPILATAMISAGIGMTLGGVMELFMKAPSLSKEEDPEASKYIGSGKNSVAIGTTMGMGGGRMLIGGQFLSLQVNSSDLAYGTFPANPT